MFDNRAIARSHDGRVWGADIPKSEVRTPEEWAQVFPVVPKLELLFATTQLRRVRALTPTAAYGACALKWTLLHPNSSTLLEYYCEAGRTNPCWNVYAYRAADADNDS